MSNKVVKEQEQQQAATGQASPVLVVSILWIVVATLRGWIEGMLAYAKSLAETLPEQGLEAAGANGLMTEPEAKSHRAVANVVRMKGDLFASVGDDGKEVPYDIEGLVAQLDRVDLLLKFVNEMEPVVNRARLALKQAGDDVRERTRDIAPIAHSVGAINRNVSQALVPSTTFRNRGAVGRKRNEASANRKQKRDANAQKAQQPQQDAKANVEANSQAGGGAVELPATQVNVTNGANGHANGTTPRA